MTAPAIETVTPTFEHHRVPAHEILEAADSNVFDMQVSPDFYTYAAERVHDIAIDPELGPESIDAISNHAGYWEAFSTFAAEQLQHNDALSDAEKQATLLLASVPASAIAQHELSTTQSSRRDEIWRLKALRPRLYEAINNLYASIHHDKLIVSDFNSQIRALAEEAPDLSPNQLAQELMNQVTSAGLTDAITESAAEGIPAAIRGAQHEIALGQILKATEGVTSVIPSEGEDDLRGVDFYITLDDGTQLAIDAKANQKRITDLARNQDYKVEQSSRPIFALQKRRPGELPHLTINSQTAETNLGDSFHIRDAESIRIRAARLATAFKQVRKLV